MCHKAKPESTKCGLSRLKCGRLADNKVFELIMARVESLRNAGGMRTISILYERGRPNDESANDTATVPVEELVCVFCSCGCVCVCLGSTQPLRSCDNAGDNPSSPILKGARGNSISRGFHRLTRANDNREAQHTQQQQKHCGKRSTNGLRTSALT